MSLLPYIFEAHPNKSILSWPSLISFRDEDFFKPMSLSKIWDQLGDIQKDIKIDKEKFEANVNVRHYKAEEITVKLTGRNTVTIAGKHEEKPEHGFISRQFVRNFTLPDDCDIQKLQTKISSDGVLVLSVPKKSEDKKLQITELPATPIESCKKTFESRNSYNKTESQSKSQQKKQDDSFQRKENRVNINESVSKTSERRSSCTSFAEQGVQVPVESEESSFYKKQVENSYQIKENGVVTESSVNRSDETKTVHNDNVQHEKSQFSQKNVNEQRQIQENDRIVKVSARQISESDDSKYYQKRVEDDRVQITELPPTPTEACKRNIENRTSYTKTENQCDSPSDSRMYQNKQEDSFHVKENRVNLNESVSKTSERRTSCTSLGEQRIQVPVESEQSRIYKKQVENSYQIKENGVVTESAINRSDETKTVHNDNVHHEKSQFSEKNVNDQRQVTENPRNDNVNARQTSTESEDTRIYQKKVDDSYQIKETAQNITKKADEARTGYRNIPDEIIYLTAVPVEDDVSAIHQNRVENRTQVNETTKRVNETRQTSKNVEDDTVYVREVPVQYEKPKLPENKIDDSFRLQENYVNVNESSRKVNETRTNYRNSENETVHVREIPVQPDNSRIYNQKVDDSFRYEETVKNVKKTGDAREIPVEYEKPKVQNSANESVRKTNETQTSYRNVQDERVYTRDIPVQYEDSRVQSKRVDDSFQLKENYVNVNDSARRVNESNIAYKTVEDERVYVREVPVQTKQSRIYQQNIDNTYQVKQNGININESVKKTNETKSSYNNVEDRSTHVRNIPVQSEESRIYNQQTNNSYQVRDNGMNINESVRKTDQSKTTYKNVQDEKVYVRQVPVQYDDSRMYKAVDNSFHIKENRVNVSESVKKSDGTAYNNYQHEQVYSKEVPVQSEQSRLYKREDESAKFQKSTMTNAETQRKSNESKVLSEKIVRETPLNFSEQVSKSKTVKKQTEVEYREVPISLTGAVRHTNQYVAESEVQQVKKTQDHSRFVETKMQY